MVTIERHSSKGISSRQMWYVQCLLVRLVGAGLREERERRNKRETAGGGAGEGPDEFEDEARVRLEKKIRELEAENFDLRRGVGREKRRELQPHREQAVLSEGRPPLSLHDAS
jgi:hypothetical protein